MRQLLRRRGHVPLQLKYAFLLTLTYASSTLLMIFIMAWFIQRNYNLFLGDELGLSTQVIEVVRNEQRLLEISLFVLFLLSITFSFAASLFVTRKLTGPLFAVQRQLWLITQGDWSNEFRLRQGDEFRELEVLFNTLKENILASQAGGKKAG